MRFEMAQGNNSIYTFPARLQSWIESLGQHLIQEGLSNAHATVSAACQLLNQYYSTFGPDVIEPQVGASEYGIGFTFELGNATLLGEVVGEYLDFETMDESYGLKGHVGTSLPLLIDYMIGQMTTRV